MIKNRLPSCKSSSPRMNREPVYVLFSLSRRGFPLYPFSMEDSLELILGYVVRVPNDIWMHPRLVDYDETNSFFGRLERAFRTQQELANGGARAKTQHVIQNLFDSSMTSLTRNAQRIETLAAESKIFVKQEVEEEDDFAGTPTKAPETEEEHEEAKVGQESESHFVNPFASLRSAAENLRSVRGNDPDKTAPTKPEDEEAGAEKVTSPSNTDTAEPKYRNPFAGLRSAADNMRKSEATVGATNSEDGGADGEAQSNSNAPMFRNPFAAWRGVVPEKKKEEASDNVTEVEEMGEVAQVADGLVDISIADSSAKPGSFTALKKNPFARFGAKAAENNESAKPNRFGGINMNQLRLNTLSNLRKKGPSITDDKPSEESDMVEESISFEDGGTPATEAELAKEVEPEAVVESV